MGPDIEALRAFNRFYTRFIGALEPHFLGTELTLAEARMMWEIANRDAPLARELQEQLGLDAGYASRMIKRFETNGWINRDRGADARHRPIAMSDAGRAVFADLDRRQRDTLAACIATLSAIDRATLSGALDGARALLGGETAAYAIRTFRAGDMGLLCARQAVIYAASNGWAAPMEALILDVCAGFLRNFQPGREQCWIAERAGQLAGSILLVDAGNGVAQLRLLYVEPNARGLGIGAELVTNCVTFAREAGYRRITLWTHTVLESARRIYAAKGFVRTKVEMHDEFGVPEQGETWEFALDA